MVKINHQTRAVRYRTRTDHTNAHHRTAPTNTTHTTHTPAGGALAISSRILSRISAHRARSAVPRWLQPQPFARQRGAHEAPAAAQGSPSPIPSTVASGLSAIVLFIAGRRFSLDSTAPPTPAASVIPCTACSAVPRRLQPQPFVARQRGAAEAPAAAQGFPSPSTGTKASSSAVSLWSVVGRSVSFRAGRPRPAGSRLRAPPPPAAGGRSSHLRPLLRRLPAACPW